MTEDGVENGADESAVAVWEERIRRVIDHERPLDTDRSEQSPLGRLGKELEALPVQDAIIAGRALLALMDEGDGAEPAQRRGRRWYVLSFLARPLALATASHPAFPAEMQGAFYARLFGRGALNGGALVYAMRGYVAAGGKLTSWDLRRLENVFQINPVAWLNAAVASGCFEEVKDHVGRLMSEGFGADKRLNLFMLSLEGWARRWDRKEDFTRLLREWLAIAGQNGREEIVTRMRAWMESRNLLPSEPEHDQEDAIFAQARESIENVDGYIREPMGRAA